MAKKVIIYICVILCVFGIGFGTGFGVQSVRVRRSGHNSVHGLESGLAKTGDKLAELDRILSGKEQNEQRAIELASDIVRDIGAITADLRAESSSIAKGTEEVNQRHEEQLSDFTKREEDLGQAVDDLLRELGY